MRLARISKPLLLILLSLALSGCLDMKQDIWINPDGSGRLRIDVGISESMSYFRESEAPTEEETQESDIGVDFMDTVRELSRDPRIRSVYSERYSDQGFDRAAIDLTVHDWHDLPSINARILTQQGEENESDIDTYMTFSLHEEDDGIVHYLQPGMGIAAAEGETGEEGFADAMSRSVAEAMFRDGALTVTLHSSTISRTNGEWQLDKSSVRWQAELVDLIVEPAAIEPFTAEIGPSARSSHFWRIVGILMAVSLLVLLLTWFSQGRRSRRKAHSVIQL